MKIVEGVYTSAKILTDAVEDYAIAQIKQLCDLEAFQDSTIRVMPDVHPGKVGTIGFTTRVKGKILPNVVGVDIGCGISLAKLRQKRVEFQKLDRIIREQIPAGTQIRTKMTARGEAAALENLRCFFHIQEEKARLSMGTLGGGNHFIEIDQDEEGNLYAVVHSGSRRLGKEVTEYYLKEGQRRLKESGCSVPYELTVLEGELLEDYLHDLEIVQEFAAQNRMAILNEMAKGMKWKLESVISISHNYVEQDGEELLIRKGAVSAKVGEPVVIPVNMRDGIILGTGLGNEDWNWSAPHGAGRILKREDVGKRYTPAQFKKEMKGIYCTCIGRDTLDEAPFAYRKMEEIVGQISETIRIERIIKPVYSFKAGRR